MDEGPWPQKPYCRCPFSPTQNTTIVSPLVLPPMQLEVLDLARKSWCSFLQHKSGETAAAAVSRAALLTIKGYGRYGLPRSSFDSIDQVPFTIATDRRKVAVKAGFINPSALNLLFSLNIAARSHLYLPCPVRRIRPKFTVHPQSISSICAH